MNTTVDKLGALTTGAQQMSQSMGANINDVLQIMHIYANVNETADSIIKKTKADVILSNVAGMNGTETTNTLQGIQQQFKLTDDQLMHVDDSLMKIASNLRVNYQTAIKEIGNGVKAAGTMAEQSGMSFEKFASILGVTEEKTRKTGSEISNAMKQIFARVGQIKSPDVEVTGVDTSNAAKALKSIGVDVIDSQTHQLRDMDSILSDVSKKWDTLTADQKAYVSFNAAATRQYSLFESIMQGYSKATDLATQALDANGYALQQQATYMDSTTAKLKTLQSTISSKWQNTIDSSFINGFISGLNGLVNALGNVPTVIGLASTALLLWKGTSLLTVDSNNKLTGSLVTAKNGITEYIGTLGLMVKSEGVVATATSLLGTSLNSLKVAFMSNPIGVVITALTSLYTVFELASQGVDQYSQKQQESFNKLVQSVQQLTSENAQIPSLISSYDELSNKTNKTADEKQKLADVTQKLTQLFPDAISGYDAEGKAVLGDVSYIQQLAKEKENLLNLQKQELATKFNSQGNSDFSNLQQLQSQMNELAQQKKKYEDLLKNDTQSYNINYDKERITTYTKAMADLEPVIQKQQQDLVSLADGFLQVGDNAKLFSQGAVNELISNLSKLDNVSKDQFSSLFNSLNSSKDAKSTIDSWNLSLQELKNSHITTSEAEKQHTQAVDSLTTSIANQNKNVSSDIIKQFASAILTMGENSNQAKGNVDAVSTAIVDMDKATDDYLKTQNDLAQTIAKVNEGHRLTSEEIYKLVKAHPELASAITTENGLLTINKDAIEKVMNANDLAFKDKLQSTRTELENQKTALAQKLLLFGKEVEGIKSVADAKRLNAELLYGADSDMVSRKMAAENGSVISQIQNIEDQLKTIDVAAQITPQSIINSSAPDLNKSTKTPEPATESKSVYESYIRSTRELYNQSKAQESIIKQQLTQAKNQKDINLELLRTNELITNNKDQISKLNASTDSLKQEYYHQISNFPQFSDPTSWIDQHGNASVKYIQEFNSASKKTQEQMTDLFDRISQVRKAWDENDNSINTLTQDQTTLNQTLSDTTKSLATEVLNAQKAVDQANLDIAQKQLDAFKTTHQAIIDGLNAQITALQTQNNLSTEQADRAQKLLDIQTAQNNLNNAMADKSHEYIDSAGNVTYTYDKTKVADLQNQLKTTQTNYNTWEKQTQEKHQQQALQDQITYQNSLIKNQENAYNSQKTIFDNQWKDITTMSDKLLAQYGTNIDKAVAELTAKLQGLNAQLAGLTGNVSLPSSLNVGGTTSGGSSTSGGFTGGYTTINNGNGTYTQKYNNGSVYEGYYNNGTFGSFDDGGIVGNQPPNKLVDIANKMFNSKLAPGQTLIQSLVGELQIPPKNIMNNFIPNMQNFASSIIANRPQTNPIVNHNYNLSNFQIVANNPEDLFSGIQRLVRSEMT